MNLVTTVLGVFSEVTTWLTSALQDVVGLFWDATEGLTFFGLLALVPLGLSICMLLFGIVRSYIKFKA